MQETKRCPVCEGELIQKDRIRLLLVCLALLFLAGGFVRFSPYLWIIAAPLILIALYLALWDTMGKGLWCRQCKNFPVFRKQRRLE